MTDTNLTKKNRKEMIEFLEKIKNSNNDDETLRMVNKIENTLTEKKFWLVFEEHREKVDDLLQENIPLLCEDATRRICKDENLPWNFVIEGDNLQALYLLLKTHKWKIKCIYIDPPYNTGAKDWKYNNDYVDSNDWYRHSKWLSMMKVRLELAKQLLSDDWFLVIAIDATELYHIWVLLDELFREENKLGVVTVLHNPKWRNFTKRFSANSEYMLVYAKDAKKANFNDVAIDDDVKATFTLFDEISWRKYRLEPFLRSRTETLRENKPNFWYPIYVSKDLKELTLEKKDWYYEVYPIANNGLEATRINLPETFNEKNKDNYFVPMIENGKVIIYRKYFEQQVYKNVWQKKEYQSEFNGTNLIRDILCGKRFDYPKSIYLVEDILRLTTQKNSVILDFFAGSGTTMHSVNLLNAEDWWCRKCIMVTNNEISEEEERELTKKWYKKWDDERENLWIAKYVTRPRTVCSINGVNVKWDALKWDYACKYPDWKTIRMSDWFKANAKYFKCGWTPRKPEDYFLSNVLLLHIKEMIELENAVEIDGVKNVAILNRDDYKNFIENEDVYEKIENIWVNQNVIFDARELEKLRKKNFKYIPVEYFWQELKDVAE